MNETLLDKAIKNYNVALMIYNSSDGDDSYLNFVGYHLQQSVEIGIKYVLDANSISYPRTHDIDQLIRIANENNIDTLTTEYIKDHSEMFSLWESRTRYVLDYQLELLKVEKAMDEVGEYLDALKTREAQPQHENTDITFTEIMQGVNELNTAIGIYNEETGTYEHGIADSDDMAQDENRTNTDDDHLTTNPINNDGEEFSGR